MRTKIRFFGVCLAVAMALLLGCCAAETEDAAEPVTLNLALYRVIPDYGSFEATVRACWNEKHPEVALNIVDWDCYGAEVPEDLDVFVFDTTNLDLFAAKGYLLPLSEAEIQGYEDLIPSIMEGCRVDGAICVVPQLLCTDLLYTRKGDAALADVKSLDQLYEILGDDGLLLDKESAVSKVCLYMQALIDEGHSYIDAYPPIREGELSRNAVDSVAKMGDMRQTEPDGETENEDRFYYAKRFADGMGRAYIGYSEAMDPMGEAASEMDFRLFSMAGDDDIPVFYVDAAAVNAHIGEEKREMAIELLNMITGEDMMVTLSKNGGKPRYLLSARYSVYDALTQEYPIYGELKPIASVPEGRVFRIKPDGVEYLEQAEKEAGLLPDLSGN